MSDSQPSPITAATVQRLREKTGAGMMDAKRALDDAKGDLFLAEGILKYRGCAIHVKGMPKEEWVMKMARQYVREGRTARSTLVFCASRYEAEDLAATMHGECLLRGSESTQPDHLHQAIDRIKNDGRLYMLPIQFFSYGWRLKFIANVVFSAGCLDLDPSLMAQARATGPRHD
jgi:hypothetical protein